VSWVSFHQ